KDALYGQARLPACKFVQYLGGYCNLVPGRRTLLDMVNLGKAPRIFAESSDPERLVPIVAEPDDILIAVTGDPMRTNAYVISHNGLLGYPVGKEIRLPEGWHGELARAPRLAGPAREGP